MNILHLCHGVYGNNNGLDTYIKNFIENSNDKNFIVVPAGENKAHYTNVIEVYDLNELKKIVVDLDIDILLIHWTGQESLRDKDDLVLFRGKIISLSGKSFNDINKMNYSPNSFVDVSFFWDESRKHKIIIISHTTYKLPKYLNHCTIDSIVHVSNEAFEVNKKINTNHFVIYPCLSNDLEIIYKTKKSKKIRIGWLGRLNKYDPLYYDFIKNKHGHKKNIEFLFAGSGFLDEIPPDNFKFLGNIKPKDFFPNIDIFLYPTSIDSFSLALLEALSQEKQCIVSNVVSELGKIGNCDIFNNIQELDESLDRAINYRDKEKLQKNRERILNSFSSFNMMNSFVKLFRYLLTEYHIV